MKVEFELEPEKAMWAIAVMQLFNGDMSNVNGTALMEDAFCEALRDLAYKVGERSIESFSNTSDARSAYQEVIRAFGKALNADRPH